ncbi:hypothetical protein J1605_013887 [Eschrichtius robustus]|uniref:Uncharacterized protein n=1 Tax=Eschrichtius robustus TaxID=9764 RepID=A0AB34GEU6_ESCRO|nr:hypothetical protein J1605_013887 [Eschrichtius robustus]
MKCFPEYLAPKCEPHEVCEAHRFPASSSGLAHCRRPGSSVTVPEGPGRRQSPARRLQPEPTGGSNPASRSSDWGRAAAPRWLGYVPAALQEFQEMRCAGLLGGAGAPARGRGRGPGQAGVEPGRIKKSFAGRGHCRPPGKRTGRRPSGDHRSSAEGAASGCTLGTMAQTPAFDKPKAPSVVDNTY